MGRLFHQRDIAGVRLDGLNGAIETSLAATRPNLERHAVDSLDSAFGAGPFSHHLVLTLTSLAGVLDPIALAVATHGAALQTMNIAELEGEYAVRLWVRGVSCDTARRLSEDLAELSPVTYAHVEHHLGRAQPV